MFGIHGPLDVSDKDVVVFRAPELGSIDVALIKIGRSIAAASAFWFDENCPVVQVKHYIPYFNNVIFSRCLKNLLAPRMFVKFDSNS